LVATVVLEVVATLTLKASEGFSLLIPSAMSIASYAVTVVVLALALKTIPMSVAYVIWTGGGTVGVAVLGALFLGDELSAASWAGVVLVIAGVALINAVRGTPTQEASHASPQHPE
jgi:multidrug transporter EmrE-like cation transporter